MATLSEEGMSRRYAIFRRVVLRIASVLLGLSIHGEDKVPRAGAIIVAANHHKTLDPVFVCMAVPRRVQWMAKKELFIFPFQRALRMLGSFPVDRQGGGRAALRAALENLSEGWALGIFPEGTRQKDQTPGEAKSGAVMLASRSGAAIVPIYIDSLPSIRQRLKGKRFDAYIGDPIKMDNTSKGRAAYKQISGEMMEKIYSLPTRHRDVPGKQRPESSEGSEGSEGMEGKTL